MERCFCGENGGILGWFFLNIYDVILLLILIIIFIFSFVFTKNYHEEVAAILGERVVIRGLFCG
jgi:uncharacterized membrane protein